MKNLRILVVDDQPHVIRVIRLALSRKGYDVECASDGIEALRKLADSSFDVLITDIDMPKMNGRELCDEMHARNQGQPPLTLVVTGSTEPGLRQWAEDYERTHFLEKPLSLKFLTRFLAEQFDCESVA